MGCFFEFDFEILGAEAIGIENSHESGKSGENNAPELELRISIHI
jgi:hypothetical protein